MSMDPYQFAYRVAQERNPHEQHVLIMQLVELWPQLGVERMTVSQLSNLAAVLYHTPFTSEYDQVCRLIRLRMTQRAAHAHHLEHWESTPRMSDD